MRSISKKSNLDRLKQQVQQTSNQQYQIQTQKDELEQTVACKKQELDSNQDAMRQLIRSVFAQNEVAAAKEKEQLNDRLDKFAYNQQVMNQQIIELNDNITDTTSLNALYEAKRKELDLNYRNQEAVLKEQIKHLSEHIEYKENKLNTINKSIESKQEELDRISADLKKKEFWINFKNVWINKWIAFVSAGFLLVVIGGFLGWPTYKVMNSVFKIIRSVFLLLYNLSVVWAHQREGGENVVQQFCDFLVSVIAGVAANYIYRWLNRNDRTTEHKRVD